MANDGAARYETLLETMSPSRFFSTRSARSSSNSRTTIRTSSRSERAWSAVSRLTTSLLVTETSVWQVSIPAARSVSSLLAWPVTTGTPSRRAIDIP